MIATAHAYSGGGLPRGFVSFRSHAEAYLVGTPNAEQRRDSWQQRYAQHGARLRARVDDVIASLDGGTQDVPLVREWVSALQPLHRRSEELISAGALLSDEPPPPPTDGAGAFHQALLLGPTYTAQIRESVWFRSYRMMLNYLYLQMTRHGVRPVDRFMLCHLAANAVEERLGVTAIDLVAGRATL
jgi:Lantibiotic biosynthesis dehydratase C-term